MPEHLFFACCEAPSTIREHFAFRLLGEYTCLGGLFPSDSCLTCGAASQRFGGWRKWLFDVLNLLAPWDGAMCVSEHKRQGQTTPTHQ